MLDINNIQKFCEEFSDVYNEDYSEAVVNLRSYIQVLIADIQNKNWEKLRENIKIIKFIEDTFNNDIEWFFSFIKKLNTIKNKANSQEQIKIVMKEEVWYE